MKIELVTVAKVVFGAWVAWLLFGGGLAYSINKISNLAAANKSLSIANGYLYEMAETRSKQAAQTVAMVRADRPALVKFMQEFYSYDQQTTDMLYQCVPDGVRASLRAYPNIQRAYQNVPTNPAGYDAATSPSAVATGEGATFEGAGAWCYTWADLVLFQLSAADHIVDLTNKLKDLDDFRRKSNTYIDEMEQKKRWLK